jgi:hypothetical protein
VAIRIDSKLSEGIEQQLIGRRAASLTIATVKSRMRSENEIHFQLGCVERVLDVAEED